MTMARVPDSAIAGLLILVVGNVVVICLEGWWSRSRRRGLVLFEFFNRFLRGGGRCSGRWLRLPVLVHGEVA